MSKKTSKYERSNNYRYLFIKANKGYKRKYYHCAYCGKIISKKNMQVDHLIPIHRVKRFGIARIIMKLRGIHNINDIQNLVSSCARCNAMKSDRMGLWIIKGDIGKHFGFWVVYKTLKLLGFIAILYILYPYVYDFLIKNNIWGG